jgi:glycosyltransferase involved in cell wall biosynthesis
MKIGLNATCFNQRPSGAKQRFIGIYNKVFHQMSDDEFIVFQPSDCQMHSWFDNHNNVRFVNTPIPSEGRLLKAFKGFFYWPKALNSLELDIFEIFNLPYIHSNAKKTLVTIHDLRGLGDENHFLYRYFFGRIFTIALKRADRVITGSMCIKRDLQDLVRTASISIIYNGVDIQDFQSIAKQSINDFQEKFKINNPFLLAVGHFEKRKNYIQLIDALATIEYKESTLSLVIIGNDNGELAQIREHIAKLGLEQKVYILQGLSDQEVQVAYKLAKIFIFPSLYEGFGIPVIEAMAAGTPMILSNISAFKEITENKGIYFNLNEQSSLANMILLLLEDSNMRNSIIHYGQGRVDDFSFEKIAINVQDLYKEIS